MKSSGVRVASWGLNSTSSVCSRARATPLRVAASTWLSVHLQHVLHVVGAGGDEHVDAGPLGVAQGVPAAVDVGQLGAGQAGDHRALARCGRWPARPRSRPGWPPGTRPRCSRRRGGPAARRSRASRPRRGRCPGDCSPSRSVVSKMISRSGSGVHCWESSLLRATSRENRGKEKTSRPGGTRGFGERGGARR